MFKDWQHSPGHRVNKHPHKGLAVTDTAATVSSVRQGLSATLKHAAVREDTDGGGGGVTVWIWEEACSHT